MIRLILVIFLLTACNDKSNLNQSDKKKATREGKQKLDKKALVDKIFADYNVKSKVGQVINEFQASLPADKHEKLKDINKDMIEKNLRTIFFTNLSDENVELLGELIATYGTERVVKLSEQVSLLNNVLRSEIMRQLFRPGVLNPRALPQVSGKQPNPEHPMPPFKGRKGRELLPKAPGQ